MKVNKMRIRTSGQEGYMLLSVMLLITLMILAMAVELPRIAQQVKREKEQELVDRGLDYATAIRRFYKKNGTYPVSLDQLENTNHLRFLRKRYKDPMTTEGEWRLVHLGEAQIKLPSPAQPGANSLGSPIATPTPAGNTGGLSGSGSSGGLGGGTSTSNPGLSGGSGQGFGTPASQMGTLNTQGTGPGLGGSGNAGGPIIGVASMSKKTSIKEFNGENEYDHWLFVYEPKGELAGTRGVFIASPTVPGSAPAANATPSPGAQPTGSPAGSPTASPQPTPTPNPAMPQ